MLASLKANGPVARVKACPPRAATVARAKKADAPHETQPSSVKGSAQGQDNQPSTVKAAKNRNEKKVQEAVDAMKKDGVDDKIARKVLTLWQKNKVETPQSFRKIIVGAGTSAVIASVFQLGFHILAANSCRTAALISTLDNFPAHNIIATVFQFGFYYFFILAGSDVFKLGAVAASSAVLGTQAGTVYRAIEELAGEKTGIALVDNVESAISTAKVVNALSSIRRTLQEGSLTPDALSGDTLDGLNAYFVLQHAEETYGKDAIDKSGLSRDEAVVAAGLYGKYDSNNDHRLEFAEFKRLCNAAGFELSNPEVKTAMTMLDKRGSGYIEFDEFVQWWAGVHPGTEEGKVPAVQEKAEQLKQSADKAGK